MSELDWITLGLIQAHFGSLAEMEAKDRKQIYEHHYLLRVQQLNQKIREYNSRR